MRKYLKTVFPSIKCTSTVICLYMEGKPDPYFVALSYFGDVKLPITNNRNEAMLLLRKLDIPPLIMENREPYI